jgi:hypothetical protein
VCSMYFAKRSYTPLIWYASSRVWHITRVETWNERLNDCLWLSFVTSPYTRGCDLGGFPHVPPRKEKKWGKN